MNSLRISYEFLNNKFRDTLFGEKGDDFLLDCLIIDDERSIAQTVSEYFNLFNVTCEYVTDYEDAIRAIEQHNPSLILLDINLGGRSGFILCKMIRKISQTPIIFISARNTDDDILAALGVGGDDYVTKPFSMAVLLAKAKAVLKRSGMSNAANTEMQVSSGFGNVTFNRNTGRVYKNGAFVKLKPMEWKLLLYLIDNKSRTITKDELLEKVWQDIYIGEGTLSVHIRHLREKLENDPNDPKYIKTVWGSGYLFEDDK